MVRPPLSINSSRMVWVPAVLKVWVAVLASLLLTGLGQVYIGEWKKGIAFFVGTFSIGFVLSYYFDYSTIMTLGTIMAIISALDAYRTLTK